MKRTRPVILGYDAVSPLGIDMKTQWDRAVRGASLQSTKDLQNWIEVYEMFAKLYRFIPW